jgi:hypothetical protein
MTIRLISPDERFETKILDCTFYYRRLPDDEEQRLRDKHTDRGKFNATAYMQDVLRYCVFGWDGVLDHVGEPCAFDIDRFRAFPQDPLKDLVRTIMYSTAGERVDRRPGDPF